MIRLEPWTRDDLPLLERLVGDAAMMEHLGGPETPDEIAARQARYARSDSGMYRIVLERTGEAVGSVGFWDRSWRSRQVYEMGWAVEPAFQGRGIAVQAAARAVALAAEDGRHRHVHAFPSVDNRASNSVCRRLGFTLLGTTSIECPKGRRMRCNDWRLTL